MANPVRCEVIERILAVVDGRPVMLTEVELMEALRGLSREAALEAVIDERLMSREASRLPQAAVTPDDEARAFEGLRLRLPPAAGRIAEADLRRLARRQLVILKYVEFRFRPLVRVGEEELRQAYQARYAGDEPSFEAVSAGLKEELERRELDRQIEAWVGELRAAAEVRYNP